MSSVLDPVGSPFVRGRAVSGYHAHTGPTQPVPPMSPTTTMSQRIQLHDEQDSRINIGDSPYQYDKSSLYADSHTFADSSNLGECEPQITTPGLISYTTGLTNHTTTHKPPLSLCGDVSHGVTLLETDGKGDRVIVQRTPQIVSSQVREGEGYVISEKVVDTDQTISRIKKIVKEETYENTVFESSSETEYTSSEEEVELRERIVEVEQDMIKRIVRENTNIETVEKIVEVPKKVLYEKLVIEEESMSGRSRVYPDQREQIVEVPHAEIITVNREKIVEVPYFREEVVFKEVPVVQEIVKEVPYYVSKDVYSDFERKVPLPVEHVNVFEFVLPALRPQYEHVSIPLYVPRFVEVPIPNDLIDPAVARHAEHFVAHLNTLTEGTSASLCEVENLAASISATQFRKSLAGRQGPEMIHKSWMDGNLKIDQKSWERLQGKNRNVWKGAFK